MKVVLDIVPPKNTGQSGKRLGKAFGEHSMMFETKESKETKKTYLALLYDQKPKTPFDGVIEARYYFFFPYNSTVKKSLQKANAIVAKTTKPDWDNIPKQIQDCMTKLQYWTDDSIIFNGKLEKYYAPMGKIVVEIIPHPKDYDYRQALTEMEIIG